MGCGGTNVSQKSERKSLKIPCCKGTIPIEGDKIESIGNLDTDNILVSIDKQVIKMNISNLQINKEKPLFTQHTNTINTIITLSNGLIATGGLDHTILIWDPNTAECKAKLTGHSQLIWKLAECDSGRLVSVSEDKQVLLWSITEKKMLNSLLPNESKEYYTCCKIDDSRIACGGRLKVLKIININNKKVENEIAVKYIIWSLLPLNDTRILVGQSKGLIALYNINTKTIENEYTMHSATVTYLIKLDNQRFISGAEDHKLILWEIDNPNAKVVLDNGHVNPIVGLIKINESRFASCSKDCIKIWE